MSGRPDTGEGSPLSNPTLSNSNGGSAGLPSVNSTSPDTVPQSLPATGTVHHTTMDTIHHSDIKNGTSSQIPPLMGIRPNLPAVPQPQSGQLPPSPPPVQLPPQPLPAATTQQQQQQLSGGTPGQSGPGSSAAVTAAMTDSTQVSSASVMVEKKAESGSPLVYQARTQPTPEKTKDGADSKYV